jgi:branched-chain amino acid transport system substrate-binding protein
MIVAQKHLAVIVLLIGLVLLPELARSDEAISSNEIRIGTIFSRDEAIENRPIRTRVIAEYFKSINNDGGIAGRKIAIVSYDDEGSSKKTLDLARTLVERDHVACLFDLGARANEVARPYVNFKKIPVLFHRASAFRQAEILGSYASRHLPDSTIAIIRAADAEGAQYASGFYEGLGMERARTSITNGDEIKKLDQGVNQVEPVSGHRSRLLAIFGPEPLQLKLSRDLAKLEWKPLLVMSDAGLSLDQERINASAPIFSVANKGFVAALESAGWKTFSRAHLTRDDWDSNAAAYGYALARSIELMLRGSSEVNRCELDVVRFSAGNWDIVDPGIPCERDQLQK